MKYFRFIVFSLLMVNIGILSSCNNTSYSKPTISTASHNHNTTPVHETIQPTDSDIHEHVFAGVNCIDSGKCVCGATTEALGHDFTEATCTAAGLCKRCGATTEALGHDFTEATCTAAGCCRRCGILNGSPLGHSYSGGRCKRCNDTNGPLKPSEAILFRNKLSDEENAQALAVARKMVVQINEQLPEGSDIDRIGMAASLVSDEYYKGKHVEKGIYYNTAYGVFIKREASCAGCTRALGLVLSCMGYQWTHVNEH